MQRTEGVGEDVDGDTSGAASDFGPTWELLEQGRRATSNRGSATLGESSIDLSQLCPRTPPGQPPDLHLARLLLDIAVSPFLINRPPLLALTA